MPDTTSFQGNLPADNEKLTYIFIDNSNTFIEGTFSVGKLENLGSIDNERNSLVFRDLEINYELLIERIQGKGNLGAKPVIVPSPENCQGSEQIKGNLSVRPLIVPSQEDIQRDIRDKENPSAKSAIVHSQDNNKWDIHDKENLGDRQVMILSQENCHENNQGKENTSTRPVIIPPQEDRQVNVQPKSEFGLKTCMQNNLKRKELNRKNENDNKNKLVSYNKPSGNYGELWRKYDKCDTPMKECYYSWRKCDEPLRKYDELWRRYNEPWGKCSEPWKQCDDTWRKYDRPLMKHDNPWRKCDEPWRKCDESWVKYIETWKKRNDLQKYNEPWRMCNKENKENTIDPRKSNSTEKAVRSSEHRKKIREKTVDVELACNVMETILKSKEPGRFVLVAGDYDYEPIIKRALKLRWIVEIWFWKSGMSNRFKSMEDVEIKYLDNFYKSFTYCGRFKPTKISRMHVLEINDCKKIQYKEMECFAALSLFGLWCWSDDETLYLYFTNENNSKKAKCWLEAKYGIQVWKKV
ncbi:12317_t:CDS:2 [Acaulospora morrowiae]|uniref:12317_t:CDS:1 n=1 Tax=Acaulospora morrowiae TaxID=94023 RepID=A0A9N8W392_9GLOM|nr:12317_t:CDS:2 [Acaulospora morrowiae]